jgi:hypothetical protein
MDDLIIISRVVHRVIASDHVSRSTNWLHEGYMDGLRGDDPDPKLSEFPDSEYNDGWLVGDEDRRHGVKPPKYNASFTKPNIEGNIRGKEVVIPRGTLVKVVGKPEKPAGRTYKVIVHHLTSGITAWKSGREFHRPEPPKVVWAGPGGYWAEASIEDVKW